MYHFGSSSYAGGQGVRDARVQDRSAQNHSQVEILAQCNCIGDHAKYTYTGGGKPRYPCSGPGDMTICDTDVVLSYVNNSAVWKDPSLHGNAIRVFSSLSGAKEGQPFAVTGVAIGSYDPSDGSRRDPKVGVQVFGSKVLEHNGITNFLPNDRIYCEVPPRVPGGYQAVDKTSKTKTRPMLTPGRLDASEFLNPTEVAMAAIQNIVNTASEKDLLEYVRKHDQLKGIADKTPAPDLKVENYKAQVAKEVQQLISAFETGQLVNDSQNPAGDPLVNAFTASSYYFALRFSQLLKGTEEKAPGAGEIADVLAAVGGGVVDSIKKFFWLFYYQQRVQAVFTLAQVSFRQQYCLGHSLCFSEPGGTVNAFIHPGL